MKIVSILPITKYSPDNELTYYSSLDLSLGDVVKVPFGRRIIFGIVKNITTVTESKYSIRTAGFELKKITSKVGKSIFNKNVFESIETIAQYSFMKSGDVAEILIPNTVREEIKDFSSKKSARRTLENGAIYGPMETRAKFFRPLIREFLGTGKSIYIVVPSLFDLEIIAEKFGRGIDQLVLKLSHSEGKKKLLKNIREISTSKKGYLIIGTASYISTVIESVSMIVLENENSDFYSNNFFGFDVKKFVRLLAFKSDLPIIYSDRYLSPDLWNEIKENKLKLKMVNHRVGDEAKITLINHAEKRDKHTIISNEAMEALKERLDQKQKGFVLSQRVGFAPATICKDCGHFITCSNCLRPMVLYRIGEGKSFFKCNTCEIEMTSNTICSNCGGWQLYSIGAGSEKIFAEIKDSIRRNSVFLLDSSQKQTEKKKVAENFKNTDSSLLISTLQYLIMSQKDIDFSFIPSFNSFATIPTYKITEKILDTISYLKTISREIIIEDYEDLDFILKDIATENIERLQTSELFLRQKLNLPPFSTLIKIKVKAKEVEKITEDTKDVLDKLSVYNPEKYRLAYKDKKTKEIIQNILIRVPKESWHIKEGVFIKNEDLFEKLSSLGKEIEINGNSLF